MKYKKIAAVIDVRKSGAVGTSKTSAKNVLGNPNGDGDTNSIKTSNLTVHPSEYAKMDFMTALVRRAMAEKALELEKRLLFLEEENITLRPCSSTLSDHIL